MLFLQTKPHWTPDMEDAFPRQVDLAWRQSAQETARAAYLDDMTVPLRNYLTEDAEKAGAIRRVDRRHVRWRTRGGARGHARATPAPAPAPASIADAGPSQAAIAPCRYPQNRAPRFARHHLLCMLTYAGRGYSKAFERNFKRVINWINARPHGAPVRIVAGPDALCRPLHGAAAALRGCSMFRAGTDEDKLRALLFLGSRRRTRRLALEDVSAFLAARSGRDAGLCPGSRLLLTAPMVADLRAAYQAAGDGSPAYNAPRRACGMCSWRSLCDRVAGNNYKGDDLGDGASRRFSAG